VSDGGILALELNGERKKFLAVEISFTHESLEDLMIEGAHYLSPWGQSEYFLGVDLWLDSVDNVFCFFLLLRRKCPRNLEGISKLKKFIKKKEKGKFSPCLKNGFPSDEFFTVGKAAEYFNVDVVDSRLVAEIVSPPEEDSPTILEMLHHSLSLTGLPLYPQDAPPIFSFDESFSFTLDASSIGVSGPFNLDFKAHLLRIILVTMDERRRNPRYPQPE
jgi:hypothetical protein